MNDFPTTGIHANVAQHLRTLSDLKGKKVLDCPAGDGRTSSLLKSLGADVESADLFPEFFKVQGLSCREVDIAKGLPYPDGHFDMAICQEGLEHFPDQLFVLSEFSRILKPGGTLLLTTPSISHLRARLSLFLVESEYYKRAAPSELDGVWFSEKNKEQLYFGHVFLIPFLKLRAIALFSGLEIKQLFKTQIGVSSLLLFPFFYPFILLFSLAPIIFYPKKIKNIPREVKMRVLWEQFRWNCSPRLLLGKHLMLSFEKKRDQKGTLDFLKSLTRGPSDPT